MRKATLWRSEIRLAGQAIRPAGRRMPQVVSDVYNLGMVTIGARAVVVKDVKPWAVVAGNPARTVKTRVIAGA